MTDALHRLPAALSSISDGNDLADYLTESQTFIIEIASSELDRLQKGKLTDAEVKNLSKTLTHEQHLLILPNVHRQERKDLRLIAEKVFNLCIDIVRAHSDAHCLSTYLARELEKAKQDYLSAVPEL